MGSPHEGAIRRPMSERSYHRATSRSLHLYDFLGVRCSSVVRAFTQGAMDRRIDPSWWTH